MGEIRYGKWEWYKYINIYIKMLIKIFKIDKVRKNSINRYKIIMIKKAFKWLNVIECL